MATLDPSDHNDVLPPRGPWLEHLLISHHLPVRLPLYKGKKVMSVYRKISTDRLCDLPAELNNEIKKIWKGFR